jgi:hypothetical protein
MPYWRGFQYENWFRHPLAPHDPECRLTLSNESSQPARLIIDLELVALPPGH